MARGRALSRHIFREKHKRQYTFTKTKLVVGFFISLFTSIFLGSYLETHGLTILRQSFTALAASIAADSEADENMDQAANSEEPAAPMSEEETMLYVERLVFSITDILTIISAKNTGKI